MSPGDLVKFEVDCKDTEIAVMPLDAEGAYEWWGCPADSVAVFLEHKKTATGADAAIILTSRGMGWVYLDELIPVQPDAMR